MVSEMGFGEFDDSIFVHFVFFLARLRSCNIDPPDIDGGVLIQGRIVQAYMDARFESWVKDTNSVGRQKQDARVISGDVSHSVT